MAEEPARDPFLRMHAVNVYVRDQERSLRFFLDTLGFQVAFDARVESGQRLVAVAPLSFDRRSRGYGQRRRSSPGSGIAVSTFIQTASA